LISNEVKLKNIETLVKAICICQYYVGCTTVFMGRLVGKELWKETKEIPKNNETNL